VPRATARQASPRRARKIAYRAADLVLVGSAPLNISVYDAAEFQRMSYDSAIQVRSPATKERARRR